MEINIPIFRAKKLDSDEYIIGDLFDGKYIIAKSELNRDISEALKHIREDILTKDCISAECKNEHHLLDKMLNKLLVNERLEHIYEIDPKTLAIHLPDMIDRDGNRIFASLDKYYIKGADIITNDNFSGEYSLQVAIYSEGCFYVQDKDGELYNLCENWEKLKVIGIQE